MNELKQLFDLFVALGNKVWLLTERLIFLMWGIAKWLFVGIVKLTFNLIKNRTAKKETTHRKASHQPHQAQHIKYCHQCGARLDLHHKFCPKCGARI